MNDLELDRAKSQAAVDKVLSYSDYQKTLAKPRDPVPDCRADLDRGLSRSENPKRRGAFDLSRRSRRSIARDAEFASNRSRIRSGPNANSRPKKKFAYISDSLRAAEMGMEAGIDAVRRTEIRKDGYLYLDGTRLTSEILKTHHQHRIMAQGYVPSHTIAASGESVRRSAQSGQRADPSEHVHHHGHLSAFAEDRLFRRYHANRRSRPRLRTTETRLRTASQTGRRSDSAGSATARTPMTSTSRS